MNQTDLLQGVLAAERQARAVTQDARDRRQNMDASIQEEIEALQKRYEKNAEDYLTRLKSSEQSKCETRLRELDDRLEKKLRQVEDIYSAHREQWVESIFERVVGKVDV